MPSIVVALSSLAMFWAGSAVWVTTLAEAAQTDRGAFGPAQGYLALTGFELSGLTVIAPMVGLLIALLLAARRGATTLHAKAGTLIRNVASLLALIVLVTAFSALTQIPTATVVTLGGDKPASPFGTAAIGGFMFAAFTVVAGTALAWRKVPADSVSADDSRYTVESVRGDNRGRDVEADEWDAAVLDEPDGNHPPAPDQSDRGEEQL